MNIDELGTCLRLLEKNVLRENLAKAGLYLVAWELLCDAIIEQPKHFLTLGGEDPDATYPKNLTNCCEWFQNNGVLTADDVKEIFEILKEHRNDIAHELPNVLLNPQAQVDEAKLRRIYELLSKVDRWCITEIVVPCNEEFDGQEIDPAGCKSGKIVFLEYLTLVLYGHGPEHLSS